MNKLTLLKITLLAGALYYAVGGVAHYFGLTIFPWFDGRLYAPYQDTVIAFVCLVLILLLLTVARDPIKNIDGLNLIIITAFLASIFSIAIIWKVDFAALGAPDKKFQTIIEGLLGFVFTGVLAWLHPNRPAKR
jgi:hypothetical protein